MAQSLGQSSDVLGNNPFAVIQQFWVVAGKVKTLQGVPVRGATVTVTPLISAGSKLLTTDAQGEFHTQYQLMAEGVNEFSVLLTVKKKGLQTAHAYVDYGRSARTFAVPVTLHGLVEDADLLSSADLVNTLAPRLKQLGPAEGLAEKSQKDYTKGVDFFLEQHSPERAVPLLAKVAANNPSCIGCRTMLGLVELSWCDWTDANNSLAESVNATLHDRNMGRAEPLEAYGTWLTWQHENEKAESFFMEALKFSPQDALAFQELGRTLLALQHPENANVYLKKALDAGAGPEARLLYVQSWLGIGRSDEAAAEMKLYLNGRDVKKMSVRVRQVWSSVQNREKVEATYAKYKAQKDQEHLDFLQRPPAELVRGLEPAKDQEQLTPILDAVGAKILEMVKNFPNTSSLEAIHQEKMSHRGKINDTQDQKFRYLCLVPRESWGPGFVEYRADLAGNVTVPKGLTEGFMLTRGFTSSPLLFHPVFRSESTFRYLGRQNVNGRNTFVVAFAQLPGKARFSGTFRSGNNSITTLSQGLAWIDADTYQIIRLHTDLLAPLPEHMLEKETLNINFNEVHFKSVKEGLWLPEDVTVTLDWNGKTLRNRHAYSDFTIFNVDASEKIGKPKEASEPAKEELEPTVLQ